MISVRPAVAADSAFLWEMLTYAASMDGHGPEAVALAAADPYLSTYVDLWPQPGDLGVIATDASGASLGAAWLRLCGGALELRSQDVPELAIAVLPDRRGQGVGGELLRVLLRRARGRYRGVVLSVRAHSPAVRLYERFGFRGERQIENRVGGVSLVMRVALDEVMLVAVLTVRCAAEDAFRSFERKAASIMARHGGTIERNVVVPPDVESATFREVHFVTFPDADSLAAYRADRELLALAELRSAAIVDTQILVGHAGPEYAPDA